MTWRKKFNIDNKGTDDLRPGQRLVNYAYMKGKVENENNKPNSLEVWLWNLTPDEFEKIMNWSLE